MSSLLSLSPILNPYSLLNHQHTNDRVPSATQKCNRCFQMTSFGAKEVKEGNFMPSFKVYGQLYHRIGSLVAEPKKQPSFLQIYFVGDDNKEREILCGMYTGIKPGLVSQLEKLLHEHKYILDFKAAVDSVPKDQKEFQVVINANSLLENTMVISMFQQLEKWQFSLLARIFIKEIPFSIAETID